MADKPPARPKVTTKSQLDACTIGGARPHGGAIQLSDYDAAWPVLFAREATRIQGILCDRAISIEHVGSTSVPGLAAKPIIDIVLEVHDSAAEIGYVPAFESGGYQLRIREPQWWQHRMLKGPDTDINLHVFTVGCPEVTRMLRFRDHLRANAADRQLYEAAKRQLASRHWQYVQHYADAKTDVIHEIMRRAGIDTVEPPAE
jgi:GrpB-like predicted nucleotidyltransferase (UPF0157 family)